MTRDYSDHFAVSEWASGDTDCEPPEPGKLWLTITEDGEEYAVIVLRSDAPSAEGKLPELKQDAEARAARIAAALNTYDPWAP